MARKNLIGVSDVGGTETVAPSAPSARPIAGLTPPAGNHAPVGGITRTLGSITQKMERAQELERQLTEGQTIIEVDPDLVDASFVRDRLSIDAEEIAELPGFGPKLATQVVTALQGEQTPTGVNTATGEVIEE